MGRLGQAAYQKTNQAFIDEWNNAIDTFGEVFSGITLVATTGDGLPNFAGATASVAGVTPGARQACGMHATGMQPLVVQVAGRLHPAGVSLALGGKVLVHLSCKVATAT